MIDRILALPLAAAAFLLIAPLEPTSFHLAFVTKQIAPFGETGKMTLVYGSLFFCVAPMLFAPAARGFRDAANMLETTVSIFAIIGTIFGSLLVTIFVLKPQEMYLTLIGYATPTTGQLVMGIFGTALALTALFAATGLLRKPD